MDFFSYKNCKSGECVCQSEESSLVYEISVMFLYSEKM